MRDDLILLTTPSVQKVYPVELRRVTARVGVDVELREMVFLANNVTWSAQTIADLYRCRWSIEVFFKELKQTLQLADFLGRSERAVKWQFWTALLAYVLLRFCALLELWTHGLTRLFALIRSALWQHWELRSLLEVYGTALPPKPASLTPILKPTFHSTSRFSSIAAPFRRSFTRYWLAVNANHQ